MKNLLVLLIVTGIDNAELSLSSSLSENLLSFKSISPLSVYLRTDGRELLTNGRKITKINKLFTSNENTIQNDDDIDIIGPCLTLETSLYNYQSDDPICADEILDYLDNDTYATCFSMMLLNGPLHGVVKLKELDVTKTYEFVKAINESGAIEKITI